MSGCKVILRSFLITTIFFQVISSQSFCPLHDPSSLTAPSSTMNTECLCKDLASAIQSVIISKMKRNTVTNPMFGTSVPNLGSNLLNLGTSVPNTGASVPNIAASLPSPAANVPYGTNDVSNPCACPICGNKWQNALVRVLGMANSYGAGQKPLPYDAIISRSTYSNCPLTEQGIASSKAASVPNSYSISEFGPSGICSCNFGKSGLGTNGLVPSAYSTSGLGTAGLGTNVYGTSGLGTAGLGTNVYGTSGVGSSSYGANLGAILSRSVPNEGNKYPEMVILRMSSNGSPSVV